MAEQEEFSKYEKARILGARALQISMDAPLLLKMDEEGLSNLNFDPLKLAEKELEGDVLPISVKRPMPMKREEELEELEKIKIAGDGEDIPEKTSIEKEEKQGEKEILEAGEIMELAKPSDEQEETETITREIAVEEPAEEESNKEEGK